MFCQKCGTKNADDANFCQSCGHPMNNLAQSMTTPTTKYAGFWLRVASYLLDYVIVFAIYFVLAFIVFFAIGISNPGITDESIQIIEVLLNLLLSVGTWLYFAIMESSSVQGTLGKKIVGIKVTDLHGDPISFWRATGRNFSKLFSALIFLVGFMMAGFTGKKQALHDMIAGCLVVKRNP
jgi:uncharacterized RDD family membrane protein YckC